MTMALQPRMKNAFDKLPGARLDSGRGRTPARIRRADKPALLTEQQGVAATDDRHFAAMSMMVVADVLDRPGKIEWQAAVIPEEADGGNP